MLDLSWRRDDDAHRSAPWTRMQSPHFRLWPKGSAFTLIELIVAISIIGVLAALVLTAVSSVRLKAQRVHCVNNVRQLSMGSFMYAQENSRHAGVETAAFPGGNWMGTLNEYAKVRGILVCPSGPLHEPTPTSGNEQGYADRAWVRWTSDKKTMFYGSYGYNGYLYSDLKLSEPGDPKQKVVFTRESAIEKPAVTPVFFDENWVDTWPWETDLPYTNLYTGQPFSVSPNQMGRCTIARHGSRSASSAPRNFNTKIGCPARSIWGWPMDIPSWLNWRICGVTVGISIGNRRSPDLNKLN